jgi:hypothetical protein
MFTFDKTFYAQLRKNCRDMVEHGGNFALDVQRGRLVRAHESTGKYSKIEMKRGLVDFHSHPSICLNNDTCAVGIPSPADIKNIVLGSLYGSKGHLVFSKEGTYAISVPQSLVKKFTCDYKALEHFVEQNTKASDMLHANFMKRRFLYPEYVRQWCKLERGFGLNVRFFALNKVPRFEIEFDCVSSTSSRLYSEIVVPEALEHSLAKKCESKMFS